MYAKQTTIINRTGLHARPASAFVAAAGKFKSDIKILKLNADDEVIKIGTAKSIVFVLSMQLSKGTKIRIQAEGPDEADAVETLTALVESGFDDL
jgi:phosphocarrier protein